MEHIIGIRREDKNQWERRVPLTPTDVKELKDKFGIKTIIQPSKIRIFTEDEYEKAGAEINEDISRADVILAVKEIPQHLFQEGKTYMFFSHTIKGQPTNMPMLKKMMELKCNLIDYERVVNERNQRLIFFGRYAGLAGMIETLHAFGQKLSLQGYSTPLERIKSAYEYTSIEEAKIEIQEIGEEINEKGLPEELCPLVVGFTGYGHVSIGAQEMFHSLPYKTISAPILTEMYENFTTDNFNFYKVIFNENDMVRTKNNLDHFELQDYYNHPEKYESQFEDYLPYLSILVNGIYWTEKYPRFVTKEYLKNQTILSSNLNLKVIGDISCDIDGSIEITYKATKPDNPTYTYYPREDRFEAGTQRNGITVMAVDNLPCEFPRESSEAFSAVLKNFVSNLVAENFNASFDKIKLPDPLRRAMVLHKGEFTPDYYYMKEFIK
ncbi:MAG: bifunctional lysine ketoglutarate reductase /saccharopine dehydrogenase family protein [Acidobacteria bacterium]|jgi:alpha-aminoadipic semialdehyde synthase|nr:bifunctional lysine ketoglutarate reductase /saccharopine dehydrogenase family protein [Acidobacteriota bacterium]